MAQYFLRDDTYFETITEIDTWPDDGRIEVPRRPAPHWDWDGSQWVEGEAPEEPKRLLPRWAFMQVLDEEGYATEISGIIASLPTGTPEERSQKSRAQGKWNHDVSFNPFDPDMVALAGIASSQIDGFNFDALWSAGEVLAYG